MLIYSESGDQVASARSGSDGTFRLRLPPGRYTLVPENAPPPAMPAQKPMEFFVEAGTTTRVPVGLDNGIR
jgi:hypothetical protein